MKTELRKCEKQFGVVDEKGSLFEEYNVGDNVLVLPELNTDTEYAVGTDFASYVLIPKDHLSKEVCNDFKFRGND